MQRNENRWSIAKDKQHSKKKQIGGRESKKKSISERIQMSEMEKENVPMEIRKETLEYDKNNPQPKPKAEINKPTP